MIASEPKNGRQYGFNTRRSLPQYWTLAMTTVNGKGESDCSVVEPTFP